MAPFDHTLGLAHNEKAGAGEQMLSGQLQFSGASLLSKSCPAEDHFMPDKKARQKPKTKPDNKQNNKPKETGGPKGPEPTRYGDWERKGIASDF